MNAVGHIISHKHKGEGMEEEGREHFYFQDDLGSPMRLADEAGRSEETYGFDEFGNDIRTAKDMLPE